MNELALFAGVGGGILASQHLGHRVVCAVERDPYCREILMRRQEDKSLPVFPIWDDIDTFDGKPWNGIIDVISAGFPCQPFSIAG
jgi:DNA (cytosine-5)-methyltransferase 1